MHLVAGNGRLAFEEGGRDVFGDREVEDALYGIAYGGAGGDHDVQVDARVNE